MTPLHIPDAEAVFSVKHAFCLKREGNKNASVSSELLNKGYGLVDVFLRFLWKPWLVNARLFPCSATNFFGISCNFGVSNLFYDNCGSDRSVSRR